MLRASAEGWVKVHALRVRRSDQSGQRARRVGILARRHAPGKVSMPPRLDRQLHRVRHLDRVLRERDAAEAREDLQGVGAVIEAASRDGVDERGEEARVATWRRQGWIESVDETAGSRIRCTASGWLRLDALAADLTALRSRS